MDETKLTALLLDALVAGSCSPAATAVLDRPAELTRGRALEIARATIGRDVFLNGLDGRLYWSRFKDEDENDDPEGGPFYPTPVRALAALSQAIGYLISPETGEHLFRCVGRL